jgi:hypothetical protein
MIETQILQDNSGKQMQKGHKNDVQTTFKLDNPAQMIETQILQDDSGKQMIDSIELSSKFDITK